MINYVGKVDVHHSTLFTPPKRVSKNIGIAMSTIDANSTNSAAHATISSKELRLLYYNMKIGEDTTNWLDNT